jgi:hypothetical protein
MAFFCKNAQEEALKEIAHQMRIDNEYKLLHELHEYGAISDGNYIETLRNLEKHIYR